MVVGQVIRRGVRLGVRIGLATAIVFGSVWLVGTAMRFSTGTHEGTLADLARGIAAMSGIMGVGVLLGAVTGGALALAPQWLAARAALRGLLAGAVASTMFLGQAAVVAFATDGGYGPILLTLLATPVAGGVAAAHSGDILGHTHHHPWLWGTRHPHKVQSTSMR
ncbi:hypothetical protein ACGFMM_24550 [Streptomyces sp. NPDC048604]|uniref:hypothetical protein n=1 Tax=Streptomyces sp. NPDC048604 TaxID=3365578 RepID=UPI0037129C67